MAESTPPTPPEVWLRGPLEATANISLYLRPVVHALLQAVEDVRRVVAPLPPELLWARPGGAPSVGFHVLHAAGSLDRLFTYARGEALSPTQYAFMANEEDPLEAPPSAVELAAAFERQVESALAQLRATDEESLFEPRVVGRLQMPSSVFGLLFHAAEHTQRHAGQMVTTARIVRGEVAATPGEA